MRKLLLCGFLAIAGSAISQTTLFQDNFASGATNWTLGGVGDNSWVVNNAYTGSSLFGITDTPNQPAGIFGSPQSNYLHITNQSFACGGLGACNANFLAGSPALTTAQLNAVMNTTAMTNVTVSFWYLCAGDAASAYGTFEYSINAGSTWLSGATYSGVSVWTQASISLPSWDNLADFRIRFKWQNLDVGSDPAFSVGDVLITAMSGVSSITTTNNITPTSWCNGSNQNLTVNFNAAGTFNAGNIYTAELSDASGSFAAPTTIGTLNSSTSGALSISATVLASTVTGNGYRIRVVASNPSTIGTQTSTNLVINALPTVTLSPLNQVCLNAAPFALSGGAPASGNYSGAGVTTNFFTAAAAGIGSHSITYTYMDGNGCSNSAVQSLAVDACASIGENELNSTVALFPNPATTSFQLSTEEVIESVVVMDLNGKRIKMFTNAMNEYTISEIPAGVYMVAIQTSKGELMKRIVIE